MNRCWLTATLLLVGCAAAGTWTKPGSDGAVTQAAYEDCRALATSAVKTDADIDEDIQATRGVDWQRAGFGRVEPRTMREHTRSRAASIVDVCMRRKGFVHPP